MNWVDFIIIGILLIFIIIGCCKGFVFSILSLFGTSVNFLISVALCKPVSNLLNSTFGLNTAISKSFTSKLTTMSSNFDIPLSSFTTQSDLNTHISETLNNSSLSGFSKKILSNTIVVTPENVQNSNLTLNNIISKSLATFISLIISFIVVFVLIYLILWLISFLSKKANQISDIRFTDRLLGSIFGFIRGSLLIIFIFLILSFFNQNGLFSGLFNHINNSTIGNWLYTSVKTFSDKYINFKEIIKSIIDKV